MLHHHMPFGIIYKLYNDNGYYYYGSTRCTIEIRFKAHIKAAEQGRTTKLYNKMREEGISTFKIEIVEHLSCIRSEDIYVTESDYIRNSINNEKNLNTIIPRLSDDDRRHRTNNNIEKELLIRDRINANPTDTYLQLTYPRLYKSVIYRRKFTIH
jgi:hypothetical protein